MWAFSDPFLTSFSSSSDQQLGQKKKLLPVIRGGGNWFLFYFWLLEKFMAHAEEESKEGRKEGRMHDSCAVFQKGKKKKKHSCAHLLALFWFILE
jgi:hypothetical protein